MSLLPATGARDLGTTTRRRREELGLTRLQLSLRLGWQPGTRTGWSPRTLVRVENGQRPLAHRGELVHLAGALEVGEHELLERAGRAELAPPAARANGPGQGDEGLGAVLDRLLAQQEEQTALLRRLVAAAEHDAALPSV